MDGGTPNPMDGQSAAASSSSPAGYAFFNHSPATLPNQLPPNVDDKPLARQKRKRTSTEDQAVLENAYNRDPKPDKAARLEIVRNVALGEKEVQIWFQNRRQSSRRKARPLLPHEVAQFQAAKSRMGQSFEGSVSGFSYDRDVNGDESASAEDQPASATYSQSFEKAVPEPTYGSDDTIPDESLLESSDDAAAQLENGSRQGAQARSLARPNETHQDQPQDVDRPNSRVPSTSQFMSSSQPASQTFVPTPTTGFGYLANKRRGSSFREEVAQPREEVRGLEQHRRLRKSTSYVRLSMTSEGAAKVVTKDSSSPSPPRPSQDSRKSFSNSQGAGVSSLDLTPGTAAASRSLKRTASGRSRDSRAWEFWCDRDSRTELENTAEKDASGSAADAIGLMRANSGRSVLGPVSSKRSSLLSRQHSAKRSKLEHSRPPLQRSHTSGGRLQQHSVASLKHAPKLKYSDSGASISIPGNDSDKENWTPDREYPSSQPARGKVAPGGGKSSRPVLGEKASAGNTMRQRRTQLSSGKPSLGRGGKGENTNPEADPELAAFMKQRSSISEEGELDCVQGLLSLSQGNWR